MTAILAPGQGPHVPEMLDLVSGCDDLVNTLNRISGEDVFSNIRRFGQTYLNRPEIISPVCVILTFSAWRQKQIPDANFFAGYSVGQWSAMVLAGMLTAESGVEVSYARGEFMAQALNGAPSGMAAIIGLPYDRIKEVLERSGLFDQVHITNHNAPGQVSIGGLIEPLAYAEARCREVGAVRVVRLPVNGAWHCPVMAGAVAPFRSFLDSVDLIQPTAPVIDNVTGNFLPSSGGALRDTLAAHLVSPVKWLEGIRAILAAGESDFLEVGYGDMLAKFGFFIDRNAKFHSATGWGVSKRFSRDERKP